jgi:hypothetical protein
MTEFRLSAGFINCAVPFWGARHIHQVVAISRHPSMKPWDVPGDYSRPICRRIIESAGVPRAAFGRKKLAGSVCETVLCDSSRPDYNAWCARNGIEGELFDRVVRRAIRTLPNPPGGWIKRMFYGDRVPTSRDYFFPWALEKRAAVYRSESARPSERPIAPSLPPRQPDYRTSQAQPANEEMTLAAV